MIYFLAVTSSMAPPGSLPLPALRLGAVTWPARGGLSLKAAARPGVAMATVPKRLDST